jgi:putative phosphoesterase
LTDRDGTPHAEAVLVGVISDTHGLLDPNVPELFAGVSLILHAGDVGDPRILASLGAVAPVAAVRGNMDGSGWAWDLPEEEVVEVGGARVLLGHKEADLLRRHDPARERFDAVVSGHSHRPKMEWKEGVLYLNPGSAGPKRFALPCCLALLEVTAGPCLRPWLVYLGG